MHTQRNWSAGWHGRRRSKHTPTVTELFVRQDGRVVIAQPVSLINPQQHRRAPSISCDYIPRYHNGITSFVPFIASVGKNENAAQFHPRHSSDSVTTQVALRKRTKKTEHKSSQCVQMFLAIAVFHGGSTPSNAQMRRFTSSSGELFSTNLKPAG
ncbi:unnamed protein product [Ectocarpus sp. 8 AP-2014]